eukprot:4941252-Pyramimonas_sp.AAC.1
MVVAAQELRVDAGDLQAATLWASRHGWKAYISACRRLESGKPSAGAGLFIRDFISTRLLEMPDGTQ